MVPMFYTQARPLNCCCRSLFVGYAACCDNEDYPNKQATPTNVPLDYLTPVGHTLQLQKTRSLSCCNYLLVYVIPLI